MSHLFVRVPFRGRREFGMAPPYSANTLVEALNRKSGFYPPGFRRGVPAAEVKTTKADYTLVGP